MSEAFTKILSTGDDDDGVGSMDELVIPFAGGEGTHSVLSHLHGAHSIGEGILGFLTMRQSNALRGVCKEFRGAVMDFPWMDAESRIKGRIRAWRAAFPAARAVNVSCRYNLVDSDFPHIRGDARARLHTVNMSWCRIVTDAAFVHLQDITDLDMAGCDQATITDAAFVHLRGIQKLAMSYCNQTTVTAAAIAHLVEICKLETEGCNRDLRVAAAKLIGSDYESEDEEEENEDDEDSDEDDEEGDGDEDGDEDEDIVDEDDDGVDGVDEPAQHAIPFTGSEGTLSVLSILSGAHSIGEGIL